jgi:ribonuclease BN (tRNA processing enzyme)
MEVLFSGRRKHSSASKSSSPELEPGSSAAVAGYRDARSVPLQRAPAHAYRVDVAGKTVAYSGDTEWTDVLTDVARDADLFICESNYFDKEMKFHLSYRTLAEHRAELRCKRLILTHLGPESLARRGEIREEVARDGLTIEL